MNSLKITSIVIGANCFAHINYRQVVKGWYGMQAIVLVNNDAMKFKIKQKSTPGMWITVFTTN